MYLDKSKKKMTVAFSNRDKMELGMERTHCVTYKVLCMFCEIKREGAVLGGGDQSLNITIKSIFEMSESKWGAIFVLVIFIRLLVPPPPALSFSLLHNILLYRYQKWPLSSAPA